VLDKTKHKKFMEQISLFEKTTSARPTQKMSIRHFLKCIKNGTWKQEQKKVTSVTGDSRKKVKKFNTPAVTISGVFDNGRTGFPIPHSGYICIDIDGKENEDIVSRRDELEEDPFVFACFRSVGGDGLALIFKIKGNKHYESFNGIQQYLYDEYSISVDKSVKDPARLRYVSYDQDCYFDPKKKPWMKLIESTPPPVIKDEEFNVEDVESLVESIEKQNVDIVPNYVEWYNVGQALARLGEKGRKYFHRISKIGESYDKVECDWQFNQCLDKESKGTDGTKLSIGSIIFYAKSFGVNLEPPKIKRHNKKIVTHQDKVILSVVGDKLDKFYIYHIWQFKVTFNKDKSVHLECVGLNHEATSDFLFSNGIRKSGRSYYKISNNIVEIISWGIITDMIVKEGVNLPKDFSIRWDDTTDGITRKVILNQVQATGRRALENDILLKTFVPENETFLSDTSDVCYLFFKNGILTVTKSGHKLIAYSEASGYIWKDTILDKDFVYVKKRSLIQDIFENAVGKQHWDSVRSTIGYMLHTWIPESGAEIVFCIDKNVGLLNEGGNGKDFFSQVIRNVRRLVVVPGKSLNVQSQFVWEQLNRDTQVLWMEDLGKHVKMEQLYNLTNGIRVRRMHTNPFMVKCKIGCSLQHLINIEGSSDQRRQMFLIFSDFYSKRGGIGKVHNDRDIFGANWKGWEEYYSMIADSISFYLKRDVVTMPISDLVNLRKSELSDGTFESLEQGVWYTTENAIKQCWGDETIINTETFIAFKRKLAQWCKLSGLVMESERKSIHGKQQKALRIYAPMKIVGRKKAN
jgi:hypothetical protein